ncbi:glycosyltransferase family 2 protein [Prochlorococcus marinus]|uniref:glycosyltransferase family 2 protein n=1 Tax=Prochlorococcus marinus TaxID=1219 RepID=UPI0022B449F8|nr:glycosyltransferase [Prochlorococcus marinus]
MNKIILNPLVSVIIPTLNRAHTLPRAINSILDQTYTNWELIIIDNYSSDNTDEIVSTFKDNRINYLKNPIRHLSISRNIGIRASKGLYIALLDSDDWWLPTKLEFSIKELNKGYQFIYHDLFRIYPQPKLFNFLFFKKLKTRSLKKDVFLDLFLNSNAINVSSVVFTRVLFNKVNGFQEITFLRNCEDYDCWLRMALQTNKFKRIKECLGNYEMALDSMSNDKLRIIAFEYLLSTYIKYLPSYLGREPGHIYSSLAISYMRVNNFKKALLYSRKCIFSSSNLLPKVKSISVVIIVLIKFLFRQFFIK